MAREYARVSIGLWSDDTFRDLPQPSQLLYLQLLSSPSLSYAGVADWRPARIARLGSSWNAQDVRDAATPLQQALLIVVDEDTEEVLVRSFVRHDGLMAQPRMAVSMAKAHAAIASPVLRGVLVHELRRLRDEQPDLAGWRTTKGDDGQALALLGLRALNPATLPVASGSASGSASPALGGDLGGPLAGQVAGALGGRFAPNAGQDLAPVSGVATPAPTPAPAPTPPTSSLRSEVGPRASNFDEPPLPRCAEHATVLEAPPCRDCRDARIAAEAWEAARRDRLVCPPCPEHPEHLSRNCPRCAQEAEAARRQAKDAGWGSWRDRFESINASDQGTALTVVAS